MYKYIVVLFCLLFQNIKAQENLVWVLPALDNDVVKQLNLENNNFNNATTLDPLFAKLLLQKKFKSNEKIRIVHIGDSHIQADLMTSVVRKEFQKQFGNAGRGLLFPQPLVRSNGTGDAIYTSKNYWTGHRITKKDTLNPCGVAAFVMQTNDLIAGFNLKLRNEDTFDKITVFTNKAVNEIDLSYNIMENDLHCYKQNTGVNSFNLHRETSSITIKLSANDSIRYYGTSLEKNNGGIIYDAIGANSARYLDYNRTNLFWEQLPAIKADCYIISLGTNEAQDPNVNLETFIKNVTEVCTKLKFISPEAVIIIATPPVSYYRKTQPNFTVQSIANTLIKFCNNNNYAYWDLFNTSKGLDGVSVWKGNNWLNTDLVHFTNKGYDLQAKLLLLAFANSWNAFLEKN